MKKIARIFRVLVTGSATMILSACYGPYMEESPGGWIKAKTKDDKPIPGLKVSYKNINSNDWINAANTDEFGESFIHIDYSSTADIMVEDIDGQDNLGEFKPEEFSFSGDYIEKTMTEK